MLFSSQQLCFTLRFSPFVSPDDELCGAYFLVIITLFNPNVNAILRFSLAILRMKLAYKPFERYILIENEVCSDSGW